ncbi:hypothetical protein BGW42_005011 [Actinomortierella wolfii]|nr:hypothetical protein BGW42_005011 [Actinomortierella wolfii]
MGYALLEDHFYIAGGYQDEPPTPLSQFYSLDLSKSWTVDKAPWTRLRDGLARSHLALVAIPQEYSGSPKGTLVLIGGSESTADTFFSRYSVADDNWSTLLVTPPYQKLEGHAADIDPRTGKVYVFGGYSTSGTGNAAKVTDMNRMFVYDHLNKALGAAVPATNETALAEPGLVWLKSRQSFVLFGGTHDLLPAKRQGLGGGRLDEYDPSKNQWKTFVTTGDIPPARADHCMAVNNDGTKVVVFGGSDMDTFMNDLYILDVASAKWTKGPNASKSRIRMACTIHNDQLIVVGGSEERKRETMHDSTPLIFNLKTNRWTDHYSTDGSDGEGGGLPIGGIVGGAAAVVAIGAVVAFFVIRKRRARRYDSSSVSGAGVATGAAAGAAGAAVASNESKPDDMQNYPQHSSPAASSGITYTGPDIPLDKLNNGNDSYQDQYNPNYAATHYGYGSPQSPYNHPASYAVSPSIGAMPSPMVHQQQAEYLNYLRQDEPISNSHTLGGSDTTPLIPPPSAHVSDYSQSPATEYHQAYYANNPYGAGGGGDAYSQAGYGYGVSYPAPPGTTNGVWTQPSAHSNSPQDYTNYVPPSGNYVPPPN